MGDFPKERFIDSHVSLLISNGLIILKKKKKQAKKEEETRLELQRLLNHSPDYPLRARSDRLEVLVALQDGELGVPDLDRVEHGGQPGCHVRPQVRHAPRCSSLLLLLLLLLLHLHTVHPAGALLVRSTGTYALSHFGRESFQCTHGIISDDNGLAVCVSGELRLCKLPGLPLLRQIAPQHAAVR